MYGVYRCIAVRVLATFFRPRMPHTIILPEPGYKDTVPHLLQSVTTTAHTDNKTVHNLIESINQLISDHGTQRDYSGNRYSLDTLRAIAPVAQRVVVQSGTVDN